MHKAVYSLALATSVLTGCLTAEKTQEAALVNGYVATNPQEAELANKEPGVHLNDNGYTCVAVGYAVEGHPIKFQFSSPYEKDLADTCDSLNTNPPVMSVDSWRKAANSNQALTLADLHELLKRD